MYFTQCYSLLLCSAVFNCLCTLCIVYNSIHSKNFSLGKINHSHSRSKRTTRPDTAGNTDHSGSQRTAHPDAVPIHLPLAHESRQPTRRCCSDSDAQFRDTRENLSAITNASEPWYQLKGPRYVDGGGGCGGSYSRAIERHVCESQRISALDA